MSLPNPFHAATTAMQAVTAQRHRQHDEPIVRDLPHGRVTVELGFVTPELAAEWLAEWNTHNRKKQAARVAGHVRDMLDSNWLFIGDAIRFANDEDGKQYLADGQHRLEAIVKSEIGQWSIVVHGLPADAQEVIDTGKSRSLGDTMTLEQWPDPALSATIARRLAMWDQGQVQGIWTGGKEVARQLTKTEIHKYAQAHRSEVEAAVKVAKLLRPAGFSVPPAILATAYAVLARVDTYGADVFIVDNVIKGVGIEFENHPARRLRTRLTRNDRWALREAGEAFMLTLKAWNHWRDEGNDSVEKLQRPRDGWPRPSEFRIR